MTFRLALTGRDGLPAAGAPTLPQDVLDVSMQVNMREFIRTYNEQFGATLILTSHYMDDISSLADRLLLISQGEIVYDGTVESLVEKQSTVTNQDVDFEDVIRQFLEQEHKRRPTGRPLP